MRLFKLVSHPSVEKKHFLLVFLKNNLPNMTIQNGGKKDPWWKDLLDSFFRFEIDESRYARGLPVSDERTTAILKRFRRRQASKESI